MAGHFGRNVFRLRKTVHSEVYENTLLFDPLCDDCQSGEKCDHFSARQDLCYSVLVHIKRNCVIDSRHLFMRGATGDLRIHHRNRRRKEKPRMMTAEE